MMDGILTASCDITSGLGLSGLLTDLIVSVSETKSIDNRYDNRSCTGMCTKVLVCSLF